MTESLSAGDLLILRAALGGGATPVEALRHLGDRPVGRMLPRGPAVQTVADVRGALGDRPAVVSLRPLVDALCMAEVCGAAAGPALEGLMDALAAQVRLERLVEVRAADARLTARVLIALPIGTAALITLVDPGARMFLGSAAGRVVLAAAAVLVGLAVLWIRHLVGGVGRAAAAMDPLTGDTAVPVSRRFPWPAVLVGSGLLMAPVVGPLGAVVPVAGAAALAARQSTGSGGTDRRRSVLWRIPKKWRDARSARGGQPASLPTVDALDLLGIGLAAGLPLDRALVAVASLCPDAVASELLVTHRRLQAGSTPVEALPTSLSEVGAMLAISQSVGAPAAPAIRLLAADLRERAFFAAEAAVERLAVLLVFPTTLLLVPAFGLLVVVPLVASAVAGIDLVQ